ncbi:hypothetical protein [Silvibacterium sp.]|uniref:hypothetical protein n=1 Tax=Silvibacterium sp. TaxID=1964179 RepID=UPI0039E45B34
MFSRRTTLKMLLSSAAGLAVSNGNVTARAQGNRAGDLLVLRPGQGSPVAIAEEFMGLGYEMSSVVPLGLLSGDNHTYVALVRGLSERGVIRVGGIVADYTRFDPKGLAIAEPHNTVITGSALEQFAGFMKRTGWRAIWSLNFAQGTVQDAVAEAQAVSAALGAHLLAFELGNEVENYGQGNRPFRTGSWDYAAYLKEFREWSAAIRKAVPSAHFAAPDTASSVEWAEQMSKDANGDVQLLTTHYYRAEQTHGSVELLATPDPRLQEVLTRMRAASTQSRIPWRLCETNSFSGGGRPGVSDAMIGALWTLDTMLLLASYGCSGINLETGVNQLGFLSSYSPIRNDKQGNASPGIPYYGMLAFTEARRGCTHVLPAELDATGSHVTSYVLGEPGKARSLVVINRDTSREAAVDTRALKAGELHPLRLIAGKGEDAAPVTFGEYPVKDDGHWTPAWIDAIHDGVLRVPAMSAVVARTKESHRA